MWRAANSQLEYIGVHHISMQNVGPTTDFSPHHPAHSLVYPTFAATLALFPPFPPPTTPFILSLENFSLLPYLCCKDIINTLIPLFNPSFYTPPLFLRLYLKIMMSFCKKSVHSFLALSNIGITSNNCTTTSNFSKDSSQRPTRNYLPSPVAAGGGGLTFFTVSGDIPRPINVIESSAFKPPRLSFPATVKRDPGGVGFLDDVGGSVDGLMSCTESLGFESSDERRVDDKIENDISDGMKATAARSRKVEKREVRKFPPPLSSLSDNGKPTFFLRQVREGGRLELTEVKIHRPDILRASRQDGRLRLHLVHNETEDDDSDGNNNNNNNIVDGRVEDENQEDDVNQEKDEERVEGWQFPVSSGGGESFRRCHEAVVGHHHHSLHGWGHHCLTIR